MNDPTNPNGELGDNKIDTKRSGNSERLIDSLQPNKGEFEFLEEPGSSAATKELLNILSVIAVRLAAKKQKQE